METLSRFLAGVVPDTTCVELLAAIPERVGKAAVLVALTTIGAFPVLTGKLLALVESVVVGDAESIVAGVKADATCVGLVDAIPKRVGMIAAPVALTTIGAFGKGTAPVETVELRAVCARGFWGEDF